MHQAWQYHWCCSHTTQSRDRNKSRYLLVTQSFTHHKTSSASKHNCYLSVWIYWFHQPLNGAKGVPATQCSSSRSEIRTQSSLFLNASSMFSLGEWKKIGTALKRSISGVPQWQHKPWVVIYQWVVPKAPLTCYVSCRKAKTQMVWDPDNDNDHVVACSDKDFPFPSIYYPFTSR